jgi:ABC-type glycerol-3-phosphate transport system substrate-binding protein
MVMGKGNTMLRQKRQVAACLMAAALGAGLVGGCQDAARTEWVVSVAKDVEPVFQQHVTAFNAGHPGQSVTLRNIAPESFGAELNKMAETKQWPTFVTMSHEQADAFPREWWANWGKVVAPAVSLKVVPSFWDHPRGMAEAWCFPLWHEQYFTAVNAPLLEKNGIAHIPLSLGELARTAPEFHKKTGKYLWIPPLGDADYAMSLLDQQGVPIINTHMKPLFSQQGGGAALDWWVQQFKSGVFPMEALHLTRQQIQQRFSAGEVGMASLRPGEIAKITDSSALKVRDIGASRDISGNLENVRAVTFGLYHPKAASLGMTAQNFVGYLMQPQVQRDLANTQNALPSSLDSIDFKNPGYAKGGRLLDHFAQVGAASMGHVTTTVGGVPLRGEMAKAIREAFVAACEGKQSARDALAAAEASLVPILAKSGV